MTMPFSLLQRELIDIHCYLRGVNASVGKLGSAQARVEERKQVRDKQVRDERRRRELQRILSPPLV